MSRIDEIKGRVQKSSPGPWRCDGRLADNPNTDGKRTEVYDSGSTLCEPVCVIPHDDITEESYKEVKANADFICKSRKDIPWLLARVEKLERVVEAAREVHSAEDAYRGWGYRLGEIGGKGLKLNVQIKFKRKALREAVSVALAAMEVDDEINTTQEHFKRGYRQGGG